MVKVSVVEAHGDRDALKPSYAPAIFENYDKTIAVWIMFCWIFDVWTVKLLALRFVRAPRVLRSILKYFYKKQKMEELCK